MQGPRSESERRYAEARCAVKQRRAMGDGRLVGEAWADGGVAVSNSLACGRGRATECASVNNNTHTLRKARSQRGSGDGAGGSDAAAEAAAAEGRAGTQARRAGAAGGGRWERASVWVWVWVCGCGRACDRTGMAYEGEGRRDGAGALGLRAPGAPAALGWPPAAAARSLRVACSASQARTLTGSQLLVARRPSQPARPQTCRKPPLGLRARQVESTVDGAPSLDAPQVGDVCRCVACSPCLALPRPALLSCAGWVRRTPLHLPPAPQTRVTVVLLFCCLLLLLLFTSTHAGPPACDRQIHPSGRAPHGAIIISYPEQGAPFECAHGLPSTPQDEVISPLSCEKGLSGAAPLRKTRTLGPSSPYVSAL